MNSGRKGVIRIRPDFIVISVFCSLAVIFIYFTVVNALIAHGRMADEVSSYNSSLHWATTLAPWSADAAIAYAAYLRGYAVTASMPEKAKTLSVIHELIDSAIAKRPLWPYYQLAKYDAEVLSGASEVALQARFDGIRSLAPNERGVDLSLIQTSLYVWDSLKGSQQNWIGVQMLGMQREKRDDLLLQISSLKTYNPRLCTQLPWKLVKRACQE
tara:strand:+ start:1239 stop:1880 length:642 start_codon:yes stop_codon:yes gene_type:complete